MPIKTEFIEFDRERALEIATTQNKIKAVTSRADAKTDSGRLLRKRDPQPYIALAFPADVSDTRPGISKSTCQPIEETVAPWSAPGSRARSLTGQPDDTTFPATLRDRRVLRRGWEREYGVTSYQIGTAVLDHDCKCVANPQVAVIDAAILRLYGPCIGRDAAARAIPRKVQ